jgi:hypothetical protein
MFLEEYSLQEHDMVLGAEARYGEFFLSARNVTLLLSNIMDWPRMPCDIFIRFLSQMKKYHTLCLMSLVRHHRIQAKMNLRYFLESTVHVAYALAHPDIKSYFDQEKGGTHDAKKASELAYKWIGTKFPEHSGEIKRIKGAINEQTAHANVFNSQHNLWYVDGEHPEIHTTYFDVDDDHWVKVDIWECAQAGLIASDLILAVQEKYGGFIPSRMVNELGPLIAANDDLLTLLECKED